MRKEKKKKITAQSTKSRKPLLCPILSLSKIPRMCKEQRGSWLVKMHFDMINWKSWHQLYRTKCCTLLDRHLQVLHLLHARRTSALLIQTLFQLLYSNLYFAWWTVPMKMYTNRSYPLKILKMNKYNTSCFNLHKFHRGRSTVERIRKHGLCR